MKEKRKEFFKIGLYEKKIGILFAIDGLNIRIWKTPGVRWQAAATLKLGSPIFSMTA